MRRAFLATVGALAVAAAACGGNDAGVASRPSVNAVMTHPPDTPSPSADVVVFDCTGKPDTKPDEIVIACADGNYLVTDITWTSWGGDEATGTGTGSQNDCDPYCANGKFHEYSVRVVLSRTGTLKGQKAYTHMLVETTGDHPGFVKAREELGLGPDGPGEA